MWNNFPEQARTIQVSPCFLFDFLTPDKKNGLGMADAHLSSMMTVVCVWFGMSVFATLGIVSTLALGARRHIPTLDTESTGEAVFVLNRAVAGGDSKLSTSFAR